MKDETPRRVPNGKVTLKQLAAHLDLSVTTVARSLRDGYKTSAETVSRVRNAARDLGYVRNLDGLRLRTGRSLTLLAILGTADDTEVGDPGAEGLLTGMRRRLAGTDYSLASHPVLLSERGPQVLDSIIKDRSCDGVIFDHIEPDDARIALLTERGIPFVTFGRPAPAAPHPWFEIDNIHAAHQGAADLITRGHRRIALIEADSRLNFAAERVEGYHKALGQARMPVDPDLIHHLPTDAAKVREAVRAIMQDQKPDAFLCSNEIFLLGTIAGARDSASKPLSDIGFSFRAATSLGAYLGLRLSASHYPRHAVGWQLADLMLRRLKGQPQESLHRLVQCELRRY